MGWNTVLLDTVSQRFDWQHLMTVRFPASGFKSLRAYVNYEGVTRDSFQDSRRVNDRCRYRFDWRVLWQSCPPRNGTETSGVTDFDELLARVRALIRRRDDNGDTLLIHGDVTVDLAAQRAEGAGRPLNLAAKELALLAYFMRHPGR